MFEFTFYSNNSTFVISDVKHLKFTDLFIILEGDDFVERIRKDDIDRFIAVPIEE